MDNRQRERCDSRIIQPEWGTRNVNNFYESEAWRIAALNETFEEMELTAAEEKRQEQSLPGRAQRQLLMDGTAVKSAFALLSTKVTKLMRRIRR